MSSSNGFMRRGHFGLLNIENGWANRRYEHDFIFVAFFRHEIGCVYVLFIHYGLEMGVM
jgi:hypothetical protein